MKFETAKMKVQVQEREDTLLKERDENPEPTAKDLKQGLSGDYKQRMEETKSVTITFKYGERPEVRFDGFWNGRLVKNAQNALSRHYRLRRHKQIRAHATVPNRGEGDNGRS